MTRLIQLLLAICCLTPSAWAHHGHVALTEVEWNHQSQRFEVAMRLRIADLEDAISMQLGRRFRLETHNQSDAQLQTYLQKHFSVTFAGDSQCTLHWVGRDLELHDVWVYFEAESVSVQEALPKKESPQDRWSLLFPSGHSGPGAALRPVQLQNSVLTDVQPEQTNVVAFKVGHRSTTKTLTAKDTRSRLP